MCLGAFNWSARLTLVTDSCLHVHKADPNCFDEHSQYQIWADVACGVLQGENSIIKKHSLCPSNRTDPRMNV